MIITCPECKTRYMIKSDKLGLDAKTVRCAKCKHQWTVNPTPEVEEILEKPPLPPIARLDGQDFNEQQKKLNDKITKRKNIVIIGLSIILVIFLVLSVLLKDTLVKSNPSLASIYELLGFSVKQEKEVFVGLVIQDVERQLDENGDVSILSFSGKIRNQSGVEVPVPNVKVQLFDEGGILLDEWVAQPEHKTLKPEETTTWICRFYNAPLSQISQFKTFLIEE